MGIKTSEGGAGAIFYKINQKDGCFQTGSGAARKQFEPGKTALEGTLIGAKVGDDEYEGVKFEVLRLIFKDTEAGQPNMHVSMTIASEGDPSSFALRTLAKINAADFSQPFSLTPYLIEKGSSLPNGGTADSDITGVSVKQNGQKLVEDMGTPDNKLPERPTLMKGDKPLVVKGREQKDSTPWVPILEAQLVKMFDRLGPVQQQAEQGIDPSEAAAGAADAARDAMRARG